MYSTLDPSLGCHPILPANRPVDEVVYATIVPVNISSGSAQIAAQIPTLHVIPGIFSSLAPSSRQQLEDMSARVASLVSPIASWASAGAAGLGRPPASTAITGATGDQTDPLLLVGASPWTVPLWSPMPLLASHVLPTFPLVLLLPYRQTWTLNGYDRGDLLNTISLAPQEETIIEVYSWDRHKKESEKTTSTESETTLEGGLNTKDTFEAVNDARRDNGWKFDVSANISVPGAPITAGPSFGIKDELTTNAKTTMGHIADATEKATAKIKATRQTKVLETSEFGGENKVVRKLRNPNTGRTLNLDCFEVVAHYTVETRTLVGEAKLGVLVLMHDFLAPMLESVDGQKQALLSFEHAMSPYIPDGLRGGFDAARTLLTAERVCQYKCTPRCTCKHAPPPPPPGRKPTADPAPNQRMARAVDAFKASVTTIQSADVKHLADTIKQYWTHLGNEDEQPVASDWANGRLEVKRYLYRRFVLEAAAQRFFAAAQSFAATDAPTADDVDRLLAARSLQGMDVLNAAIEFALLEVKVVQELAEIVGRGCGLVAVDMAGRLGFHDAGLESALKEMEAERQASGNTGTPQPGSGATDGGTATGQGATAGGSSQQGAPDEPSDQDLAAASVALDALLGYLRNNTNFFRALLWRSIDAADRLRFLQMYGRLSDLVTQRIIGFCGTYAVLEFDLNKDAEAAAWFAANVTGNSELVATSRSFEAALPTPGVTLEARLGVCDALEPFLVDSRAAEARRVTAVAAQEEREAERLQKRLEASMLDDPTPDLPPLRVRMDTPNP